MKKHKNKRTSLIIILTTALIVGVVVTIIAVLQQMNSRNSGTQIFGSVTLTTQGPADEVTGSEPSSATLLVGKETGIRKALKAEKDSYGSTANYVTSPEQLSAAGVRAVTTSVGKYKLNLATDEDTLCIVNRTLVQTGTYKEKTKTKVNYMETYSLGPTNSCTKVTTSKSKVHVDISTIQFGVNTLDCLPTSDCSPVQFSYK